MTAILLSACVIVLSSISSTLTVTSPAFNNEGPIPIIYTCEGKNINPEIRIGDIPAEAKSLVIIMEDPDTKKGVYDHWVMWNIPVQTVIPENSAPGAVGMNGAGQLKYKGPCPPDGTHRYFFKVYALDAKLNLKDGANKAAVEEAMKEHIIATGELIGLYKKSN